LCGTSREDKSVAATSTAEALSEVSRFERRAREAFTYGDRAAVHHTWRVVTTTGYLHACYYPKDNDWLWIVPNIVGLAAAVTLGPRRAIGRLMRRVGMNDRVRSGTSDRGV